MADSAQYLISPTDAVEALRAGAILVDVRQDETRLTRGTIPGAVVVDKTALSVDIHGDRQSFASQINSLDTSIVIFCSEEQGSIGVVLGLRGLGFTEVYHVEGGFDSLRELVGHVPPVASATAATSPSPR